MNTLGIVSVLVQLSFVHCPAFGNNAQNGMTYISPAGIVCAKCPAGMYLVNHCQQHNQSGVCKLCPNGTFQSVASQATSCEPCLQYCLSKFTVPVAQCTSISNMRCDCPVGTHNIYPDLTDDHAFCTSDDPCDVGHGVIKSDPTKGMLQCGECEEGKTFSSNVSTTDRCIECKVCADNLIIISECNTTHDRVCISNNHSEVFKKENEKDGHPTPHPRILLIAISVIGSIIVIVLVVLGVLCWRSRNLQESPEKPPLNDIYSTSVGFSATVSSHGEQSYDLSGRTNKHTSVPSNMPLNATVTEQKACVSRRSSTRNPVFSENLSKTSCASADQTITDDSSDSTQTQSLQPSIFKHLQPQRNTLQQQFTNMSRKITFNWKDVMRYLITESGINDAEEIVKRVDIDFKLESEQEKAYQCLLKWKEVDPKSANRENMINALDHYGMEKERNIFEQEFPFNSMDRPGETSI